MEFKKIYLIFPHIFITRRYHTSTRDGGRKDERSTKDLLSGLGGPCHTTIMQKGPKSMEILPVGSVGTEMNTLATLHYRPLHGGGI